MSSDKVAWGFGVLLLAVLLLGTLIVAAIQDSQDYGRAYRRCLDHGFTDWECEARLQRQGR